MSSKLTKEQIDEARGAILVAKEEMNRAFWVIGKAYGSSYKGTRKALTALGKIGEMLIEMDHIEHGVIGPSKRIKPPSL